MTILIENTETESKRIKWTDLKTKSKILIDAQWLLLGSNKSPYLSIDVLQVVKQGERIKNWQSEKETIKSLNSDLSFLVDCHLSSNDGFKMHQLSNMIYYFEKTRGQLGKTIYTSEDHYNTLLSLSNEIRGHAIFKTLKRINSYKLDILLDEYFDQNSDRYKYLNVTKSINHWVNVFKSHNYINLSKDFINSQITDYFYKIAEYQKIKDSFKYKNLPNRSDLWNVDRFCKYYSFSESEFFNFLELKDQELKQEFKIICDKLASINKNRLQVLTDQYKIPLVNN